MGDEAAQAIGNNGIRRGNSTAFTGGKIFNRVKAKTGCMTIPASPHRNAFNLGTNGMGGIFHHIKPYFWANAKIAGISQATPAKCTATRILGTGLPLI